MNTSTTPAVIQHGNYSTTAEAIEEALALNTAELADMADVTWGSGGGYDFLRNVRDLTVNGIQNGWTTYWEDLASEVANSALPIYNGDVVEIYGDLQAWRHDATDYFPEKPEDALQLMSLTLYSIAHTVSSAVAHRMVEEA